MKPTKKKSSPRSPSAPTLSALATIKMKGFEVNKQKTILWSDPEYIVTDVSEFDFYISQEYEGNAFIVLKDKDESKAITMAADEVDTTSYDVINDKGLVAAEDVDFSINIGIVTALRDDKELGIEEGEKKLKAYVA